MVVEGEMSNQTLVKARLWVKATWVMFNLETLILTVSSSRGLCRYNIQGIVISFQQGLPAKGTVKYQIPSWIMITDQIRARNLQFQFTLFLILTSLNQLLSKARKYVC